MVSHDERLTCEQVRFGRSTDNEVELLDSRVLLHEGALHMRANGLFYEAAPQANAMIDGRVANSGPVRPGSVIQVGPYEVVVLDPAAEDNAEGSQAAEVAVSVEMVRPPDDSLALLQARSRTSLADAGWGRRGTSWALALTVLALFLVWPVVGYFIERADGPRADVPMQEMPAPEATWPIKADLAWDSGEVSGPHKFIADDCGACHLNAFEQVPDRACAVCHEGLPHHVDPVRFAAMDSLHEVAGVACQSCHKEHRGPEAIIRSDQAFCADCHSALDEQAPETKLLNAADFGYDHPQFRPSVVVDAAAGTRQRITLDQAAWPEENSNLRFTHAAHMKPGGLRVPGKPGFTELQCTDCHAVEPGGAGLRPIDMEQHCAECHLLRFEPAAPDRTLPHGDLEAALLTVQEFYSDLALRGGVTTPDAPAVVRRRPGTQLTEQERLGALAWAEEQADKAALYASRSVCGVCHEMSQTVTADTISWDIKPVLVTDRWLPKGLFHHGSHDNMECSACHKAETSKQATDVLLPQIGLCQQCHGGEQAADRVPTGCIQCHNFHFEGLPAMTPAPEKRAALDAGGVR